MASIIRPRSRAPATKYTDDNDDEDDLYRMDLECVLHIRNLERKKNAGKINRLTTSAHGKFVRWGELKARIICHINHLFE